MRRFIALCAAVLVAALVAFAVVPFAVAPEAVRDAVAARLADLTGHKVEITGATELYRFPYLRFAINDIRLQAERTNDGELAKVAQLTGSIALLPLFVGRVEAAGVTLVRPELSLVVDRQGRANWAAESGQAAQALMHPQANPASQVLVGDIRIEQGSIRYLDRRSGDGFEVEAVTGTVSWPDLSAPLAGTGSLVWRDDPVDFNFVAKEPFSFLRRGSSRTRISVASPLVSMSFSGDAHLTDNTHIRGRLALSTASARRFLRRLGTDLGSGHGLDAMELSGQLSLLGNTAIISALSLELDGNAAEGSLKVDIEQNRIGLQGTLAFESLDLNHYRMPELLGEQVLPVEAMERRIDLSVLRSVEADLRISADRVAFAELELGETAGTATVRDGALTLGLAQTAVFGGSGIGTISLFPHPSGVGSRVNATWERISLGEVMTASSVDGRIAGTTSGWAKLAGEGATIADILAVLSGEATIVVKDGALTGVDVPRLVELVGSRRLLAGWPSGDGARTPFERLNARLDVVEGVATTTDLQLTGPDLEVTMIADIELAAASVVGRGNALLAQGGHDALPFTIHGPIVAPRLRVDRQSRIDSARRSAPSGGDRDGILTDELFDRALDRLPAQLP